MKNILFTFCFAFVPGAGQMYQGYMKRGLSLIAAFCMLVLLSGLCGPLVALTPIVWMYSFFDTFNLRGQLGAGTAPADEFLFGMEQEAPLQSFAAGRHLLLGGCAVALGVYMLYDSILMPMLYQLSRMTDNALVRLVVRVLAMLPTLAVALAFIGLGLWLVRGPRGAQPRPREEEFFIPYRPAPAQPEPDAQPPQAGPDAQPPMPTWQPVPEPAPAPEAAQPDDYPGPAPASEAAQPACPAQEPGQPDDPSVPAPAPEFEPAPKAAQPACPAQEPGQPDGYPVPQHPAGGTPQQQSGQPGEQQNQ